GDAELRLVSVRPGTALGKVSAILVYLDKEARLVTLEILPGNEVQIPPNRTRKVQQFRPVLARVEQCGVVLWKMGGALYVPTAPSSPRSFFMSTRPGWSSSRTKASTNGTSRSPCSFDREAPSAA